MNQTPILSRPVKVDDMPGGELDIVVEASQQERDALAADYGLAAIESLAGRFHLVRKGRFVNVTGEVAAKVEQTCVVSLEPFTAELREPVELRFTEPQFIEDAVGEGEEHEVDLDAPDPIENGKIDLGQLTAEILSLALDPYPRKPGVSFEFQESVPDPSPFAALEKLKGKPQG